MATSTQAKPLERRETSNLIGSDKVEGTPVCALGGYEINVTEQQLKNAPKYSRHDSWDWADRARTEKVSHYYGL